MQANKRVELFSLKITITHSYQLPMHQDHLLKEKAKKNTTEQELAAIPWPINHFRTYIYGRHFTVKTDHRPLTYIFSVTSRSSKLMRMRLDLEEYDFTVEYLKPTRFQE